MSESFQERLDRLREVVHPDLKPDIRTDLSANGWPDAKEAIS